MTMSEKVTLNHCGYQSALPSPLLSEWLDSFDGVHPLLDIGCAFGINTYKALEQGIPCFALDPDERHLRILRENTNRRLESLLTCITGSLPNDLHVNDESVSGILCAEVLHFLDGPDIEKSLNFPYLHKKLVKGGKLIITANSDNYLGFIDKERYRKFHDDIGKGIKWPGVIHIDNDLQNRFLENLQNDDLRAALPKATPKFLHFTPVTQIAEELERNGFRIIKAYYGVNHGHLGNEKVGKWEKRTIMCVSEKE